MILFPDRVPPANGRTHATYALRGEHLDPTRIVEELGLVPSWGFRKGDRGPGGIPRPWGVWGITSLKLCKSEEPCDHVKALLEVLRPGIGVIKSKLAKSQCAGVLHLVQAITPGRAGYSLPSEIVAEFLQISNSIEIEYILQEMDPIENILHI